MAAEIITLVGLIGLACLSMWMLPADAKDIVMNVVSGLLGYIARGVLDKQTTTNTVKTVSEVKLPEENRDAAH